MKLGLIARADSRGLGIQTKAVHDNLHPAKTMVIDCPSAKPLPLRPDWFPDATWVHGLPTAGDFQTWLNGLDVVYTAETGYSYALWDEAERAGVKTVLHVNPEFYDRSDRPTVWAAPSMWRYDELPEPKCFLPVPIETSHIGGTCKESARNFVHVVGRPATRDRNGTEELLQSLQHVTATIRLTVTCQEPGYVENLLPRFCIPANVELIVRSGDLADNTDLYRGQDVLLMPRRFGGLCLPLNEALGHAMPVVMPAISPNDSWMPADWLVPATYAGQFMVKQNLIDFYSADHLALARKIDQLSTDPALYLSATEQAAELRDQYSWTAMRPVYQQVFSQHQ